MYITETINNSYDIDPRVISEYFESLEEDESPDIWGLIGYVNEYYSISDFQIYDTDFEYHGDRDELLTLFEEYKRND